MTQIPQEPINSEFVREIIKMCREDIKKIVNKSRLEKVETRSKKQNLQKPLSKKRKHPELEDEHLHPDTVVQPKQAFENTIDNNAALAILEDQLKTKAEELKLKIKNHHEFLNDAIEIKIESIRESLLNAGKSLLIQAKEAKEKSSSRLCLILSMPIEEDILEVKHKKEIKAKIELVDSFQMNAFTENTAFKVDESSIGTFNRQFIVNPFFIANNFKCDFIDAFFIPRVFLKLNKTKYLVTQQDGKRMLLLDSKYKEIERAYLYCLVKSATHDSKYIYIADSRHFTKYNLNLKTLTSKAFLSYDVPFENTGQIFSYKDRIYALMDSVIVVLTKKFEYVEKRSIEGITRFFEIKIINETVCVSCCTKSGLKTCFLRLQSFELFASCSVFDHVISAFGNYFVTYNGQYIVCFDASGNKVLVRKIEIGIPMSMTKTDDALFICLKGNQLIAKIQLKNL